jgi:endonuclease/exonuclease/phosphatase family metal-dependent hydrolase
MKRRLFLSTLVASLMLVSFGCAPKKQDIQMRACSFNLRGVIPGDKNERSWNVRKDIVANFLKKNDIDICGTQESAYKQFPALKELLPEYGFFGKSSVGEHNGRVLNLVMYKKSKYKMLKAETLWLTSTPNVISKELDSSEPRTVTYGHFVDNKTGRDFFLFSTHFDHKGKLARPAQSKILMQLIEKIAKDKPFILVGDFNSKEESEVITYIKSKPYISDSRTITKAKPIDMPGTYHGFKGHNNRVFKNRIDYLWVSKPSEVLNYEVSNYSENGIYPSDHYPIVCDVVLK